MSQKGNKPHSNSMLLCVNFPLLFVAFAFTILFLGETRGFLALLFWVTSGFALQP